MEQQSRPKWTEAQQKAISCRGGTVLVSAAAGSGIGYAKRGGRAYNSEP